MAVVTEAVPPLPVVPHRGEIEHPGCPPAGVLPIFPSLSFSTRQPCTFKCSRLPTGKSFFFCHFMIYSSPSSCMVSSDHSRTS